MRSGKRRLTRPLARKDRIALFERTLHPTQDHPWPFTDRQLATLRARLGEIDCPRRIEAEAMIVPLARQFLARVEGQRPFNNKRVEPRAELARLVQAIDGLWEAFQGLSLPTRQLLGKNRVLLAILYEARPMRTLREEAAAAAALPFLPEHRRPAKPKAERRALVLGLARAFDHANDGEKRPRGRVAFVQAVLQHLGEPSDRKSIEKILGQR
jgi:hypothetical protein